MHIGERRRDVSWQRRLRGVVLCDRGVGPPLRLAVLRERVDYLPVLAEVRAREVCRRHVKRPHQTLIGAAVVAAPEGDDV